MQCLEVRGHLLRVQGCPVGGAVEDLGRRVGHGVGQSRQVDGETGAALGQLLSGASALPGQPVLDAREGGHVEEALEDLAPRLGSGAQEGGELALGEQHHLAELLQPHAEDLGQHRCDIIVPGVLPDPRAAHLLVEHDAGRRRRLAVPSLLGPHELGGALDPEAASRGGELQGDTRDRVPGRMVAAQRAAAGAGAGHSGIQREAHGIEDARLARPGGPADEEEPR